MADSRYTYSFKSVFYHKLLNKMINILEFISNKVSQELAYYDKL